MPSPISGSERPEPISAVQAEALRSRSVAPIEEVRPGIWTLGIPFAGGVVAATLTYVLEGSDGVLTVIDPGWEGDRSLALLDAGLSTIGRRVEDIGGVVVTHLHVDHLGAAEAIRSRSGALIAAHPSETAALRSWREERELDEQDITGWGVPAHLHVGLSAAWGRGRNLPTTSGASFAPDLDLGDGAVLPIAGRTIRAVWTPGHTSGHLCFVDETERLLFTGDHVLPTVNPGIGLGGRSASNPLDDYLGSLERLESFDGVEVCPGHEYRFEDVRARSRALVAHRVERSDFIASALDALDHPTLYEVACRVPFRGGIESLSGYVLGSALAQTGHHVRSMGRGDELRVADGTI